MSDQQMENKEIHSPTVNAVESHETEQSTGSASGKKMATVLVISMVLIMVLTGMVWSMMISNAPGGGDGSSTPKQEQAGKMEKPKVDAPDVVLQDNFNRTVSLKGAMSTPRYYYFWASWCGVCMQQNPQVHAAFQKYGARIDFYAINLTATEEPETLKQWIDKQPFPFVMLFDPTDKVVEAYGVRGTPTQVFISKSGKIVDQTYALEPAELDQRLASLLSQE